VQVAAEMAIANLKALQGDIVLQQPSSQQSAPGPGTDRGVTTEASNLLLQSAVQDDAVVARHNKRARKDNPTDVASESAGVRALPRSRSGRARTQNEYDIHGAADMLMAWNTCAVLVGQQLLVAWNHSREVQGTNMQSCLRAGSTHQTSFQRLSKESVLFVQGWRARGCSPQACEQ
jgi:hypothetical protein